MARSILALTAALPLLLAGGRPAAADEKLPPESEYVVARDDDLYVGEQRVRFWGGIGGFPPKPPKGGGDPYKHNQLMMERIHAYGFNMWRIWRYARTLRGQNWRYTKGDGSQADRYDHMIALARANGMRLWMGGAGANLHFSPDDVDIIDDPATADAWKQAVNELGRRAHVAAAWDARLEAILIRNNARLQDHVNQHTGLRVGDDPVFAIWELNNEQWWIVHMVRGDWQKMPEFFQDSLIAKWHEFLRSKYGTQDALIAQWSGLKPGEGLAEGTIYLAPLRGESEAVALNDANPRAAAKFKGEPVKYGREDFSIHRGRDVNEFFAGLVLAHKKRVSAAFKEGGRAAKLSPLLWDTGIGYNGICQFLHQNADAVSHCAYIAGWTHDKRSERYPWFSGLTEPPRICMNVPWLEHNTVEGKPYFVYETQIGAPSKYRVEFPYRLVFLAALQGWDAVCWHTISGGYDFNRDDPLTGTLAFPGPAAYQFTYRFDETQLSAMHAAGKMFTNCHLKKAPEPTKFIYGRKTLYHPDSMDYAGSYGKNGEDMLHTAYRYGSRIFIDTTREDDEITGPTVPLKGYAHPNPLRPTDQMTYDWSRGYLTFDSPGAMAFTGFLSSYGKNAVEFENGVRISNVTLDSPPDMAHPVTQEEGYVAVGLTSTDGKPLAECRTAILSAVSTSCNKGLKVGVDPKGQVRPGHAWARMKVFERGTLPVQHTRVGCTITSPHVAGMTYRLRDWHWKVIGKGKIGADGALTLTADQPVFLVELER